MYVDDFGHEQGPFSTARMRTWLRKGYITKERRVRQFNRRLFKQLWEWSELDVMAVQQRARRQWHIAGNVVVAGRRSNARNRRDAEARQMLGEMEHAAQQRYARSSFGFDALVIGHRRPNARQTSAAPLTTGWL